MIVESFDPTWIPSTIWYHDHAMDITGFNVSRGLAGFYLMFDEREEQLIEDRVLPDPFQGFDIGLALTDQRFNADGTGQWLELAPGNPAIAGFGKYPFADQADIAVNTRLAETQDLTDEEKKIINQ